MAPRPWERASRAAAGIPTTTVGKKTKGVAKRQNAPPRHKSQHQHQRNPQRHVAVQHQTAAAAGGQHQKIPGTFIKTIKGGATVRVVQASSREFSPNDILGVTGHMKKLQRTGQATPVQQVQQQTKWAAKHQKSHVKGQAVPKSHVKGQTGRFVSNVKAAPGRFASNFKAKVQQSGFTSASGLKFVLPAVASTVGGVKFTPAGKFTPAAKVAATYVKKKILKPTAKAGGVTNKANAWAKLDGAPRHTTIQQEGRKLVNNTYFTGKVVSCGSSHAWVLPSRPTIPAHIKPALKKMNEDNRAANKADPNWSSSWRPFAGGIKEDVVFVARADVKNKGLTLKDGMTIRFKLYTDSKGVGGCEVMSA